MAVGDGAWTDQPSAALLTSDRQRLLVSDTGLSTDYLNHFTEAVMALEFLDAMPEGLADLRAWRPKTYSEHFAASRFAARGVMINAYWAADPKLRRHVDEIADELNTAIEKTRLIAVNAHNDPSITRSIQAAMVDIKPLIVRLAAIINGRAACPSAEPQHPQAAIDDLFR